MKNLFNLKLVALLLSFGLFATSCTDKDKDGVKPDSSNTEYNGEKYTIKNGYYVDGGGLQLFGNANTHYMDLLFMTDGNPEFDSEGDITEMRDGKVAIVAALISAGGTEFKPGTFEYSNLAADEHLTEQQVIAKYQNKSFFFSSIVRFDTDGDKDWDDEVDLDITGGTFKVIGNMPNITTEYDLTLSNGKNIKGSFAGTFQKLNVDLSDDDDDDQGLAPITGQGRKNPAKIFK